MPAPTLQAPRADQLVLDIAWAYDRLGPHAHRSLSAFMAGDHSIQQSHDTALQIVATTNQEDLVLIMARLLVMVDDEVGEQAPPRLT
ncbi:hypothetical protein, partial [Roseateles sp.]|uniref:hypothetical protein n=1 Tax=Roseateles sp. TaxID=1971397 RepID=UPI00286B02E8